MSDTTDTNINVPVYSSHDPSKGYGSGDYVSIYTPQEDPYRMVDIKQPSSSQENPLSEVQAADDSPAVATTPVNPDTTDYSDYVIGSSIPEKGPQKDLLIKTLDKYDITGEKRKFLLKTAYLESGYRINALNRKSSASGWFQFIDSTRKRFSNADKYEFLSSPDEQVLAASKYYDELKSKLNGEGYITKAKAKGITPDEAVSLSWLNGKWARNFIDSGKDTGSDANGSTTSSYLAKYRSAKNGGKLEYLMSLRK